MNKLMIGLGMIMATWTTAGVAVEPQRSAEFFPLGVYWPGEYVPRAAGGIDWQRTERLLDLLASNHCNTVWLTHTGAADAAEFARRAAKRGIYLVASLNELSGHVAGIRRPEHWRGLPVRVMKTWGDAPKPIAWGLGDEPRTSYMHEMQPFVEEWAKTGEPTTTVVMAGDLAAAGALLPVKFLCSDIYPFFSANNPNGPDNIAESAAYIYQAGRRAQSWAKARGIEWWFMGQIFQEPWGNREPDELGNVVYLPGYGPHFRMPTVPESRWQNWAALAAGARGLIHFTLFLGEVKPLTDPNAKPLPFGFAEKTNSGSPTGMLYHDDRTTPQFEELGRAFGAIRKLTGLLKQIEPDHSLEAERLAFHAKGWIPPGDIVQVMRPVKAEAGNSRRYVVVANGEVDNPEPRVVAVNFAPEVTRVVDLLTGEPVELSQQQVFEWEPVCAPFRQARLKLAPGAGTMLELTVETK